jgi:hypothetical protein
MKALFIGLVATVAMTGSAYAQRTVDEIYPRGGSGAIQGDSRSLQDERRSFSSDSQSRGETPGGLSWSFGPTRPNSGSPFGFRRNYDDRNSSASRFGYDADTNPHSPQNDPRYRRW